MLLGAPTGSGKTVAAELAIFRCVELERDWREGGRAGKGGL